MPNIMRTLILFATTIAVPTTAISTTIVVPSSQHPTIQDGINAAMNGDDVYVMPSNTYYENIDFKGKSILVWTSFNPSYPTVIDGGQSDSVVTCNSGEGPDSWLYGFTITNGKNEFGGGMRIEGSSPKVSYCVFSGNSSIYNGGGIYVDSSSPSLDNCTFESNYTGSGRYGGGIYNYSSSPTLVDCLFHNNSALHGRGGGMYNHASSPTLTGCTFSNNSTDNGGGMFNYSSSSPTVSRCTFTRNQANYDGGGMYNVYDSSPIVTNCTFFENSSALGGGMDNYSSSPTVTNCTLYGNTASIFGGGIFNASSSAPSITNCILWENYAGDPPQTSEIHNITSSPTVTFCDVKGGWPGTGNINLDPLFADPVNGDFHLVLGSDCIDVGDDLAPGLPTIDFDEEPRILDGDNDGTPRVDMGADEFFNPTLVTLLYLKANGFGPGVLVEWETATEINNAGFHLWRRDERVLDANHYRRITSQLIPAKGGATWGAYYSVIDDHVRIGQPVQYLLEDISYEGVSTFHGPVQAVWK